MKCYNYFLALFLLFLGVPFIGMQAQAKYTVDMQKSSIKILGTSNLHDWDMNVKEFNCSFFTDKTDIEDATISGVSFNCKVESLESGNGIMNSKTHKALKDDKFPTIRYTFVSQKELVVSEKTIKGSIIGTFEIAGKKKQVPISFTGTINSAKIVNIVGTLSFLMTDFDVDPPKAMFGTLKTGDKITMEFNLTLINN